ncbi:MULTISPECIES: M48 family metalloprotease [unclassified Halomonas]|uniref:M48 family metalloprotease n=1 Tax=unclassified Halomonas TaxID=2609666 RepID=UPI0006DB00CA|nr:MULTISPECIES: M48 family metalloprotease [unclassified Halomonas]KPQ20995.1 MAG: family M48 peptidase [Halomonas sp. HL-93]SBR46380.1 Putative Zn-dependent protease, contains TPR repeats [Halomonas sp. HL-93]SNY98728.1 Putative Zn-dependent protease, contains TPR repeats [Halomonas sp. hl-4]
MPRFCIVSAGWTRALALACSTLLIPLPAVSNEQSLPSLGSSSSSASSEEYRLGRAWLRQFRAQAPQWQDPIANDYLNSLINRLAPHSQLGDLDVTTVMVDHRTLNAFAVPGGVIGINAGLFAFAEDEGAFVSVIAHELGHLSQRHYARGSERAEQTQLPAMAGMLAGLLIAAGGGGNAGIATVMGSQAALIQDQLTYSRRYEQEADRVGLQAMADAGYDPEAMVGMFRTLQRMASLQGGTPPEFLLTHPVSESRLSDAQSRAAQMNIASAYSSDTLYDMIRGRALLQIHQQSPQQASSRLAQEDADETAQRYVAALVDAKGGRVDNALQALDQLSDEQPDLAMLPGSAADVALQAQRYDEAIQRSQQLLRLMPNYLPAQLVLAEAQLQRDPDAAYDVLRDVTSQHPENPQGFNLLSEAAGRSGRNGWGHLARAEYLQLTGRMDRGIRQLDIAEDAAERENDQQALARIEQRRKDFMDYREALEQF